LLEKALGVNLRGSPNFVTLGAPKYIGADCLLKAKTGFQNWPKLKAKEIPETNFGKKGSLKGRDLEEETFLGGSYIKLFEG